MGRQTTITRWADRIIEGGWLLAVVFTPYFFNLLTARHFEPDKAMALRSFVLVMLAAWAVKAIERVTVLREPINWRAWWRAPLAIPAIVFAGVFVLSTLVSVQPTTSWWGSYQRAQGTYTNLSYIALFALIVGNLRHRVQFDRLITTIILAGVSVAMYGLVQHTGYDPLPWKGDVITRVSSTMGNSIFVAAYLIMVVPLILYRLTLAIAQVRGAPGSAESADRAADWGWILFFTVLFLGQQALLLGILKFMSAVRVVNGDFRYWWVFPLGLALVAATFALVNTANTIKLNKLLTSTALAGVGLWSLLLLLFYTASAGVQRVVTDDPLLRDWWLWLLLGVASIVGFLVASFFLPRRSEGGSRTFAIAQVVGYSVALLATLLAIFFSQSRGPWIGGMVGVGLFVLLLLIRLIWTGQASNWTSVPLLRRTLWGTIGLGVVLAGLLLAFNVSDAPVFERLREVQYIGRLGRLLETDTGTGRVRTLIWFGDEQGGGAVGLLRSNWLRTLTIGHGPESMFTAYNPFYPPELAQYEQRGASPDRSHQAWLDELVTKGAFGLLSYFFLFGSAIWLGLRHMRRSGSFETQLIGIAIVSLAAAHFVEVLVGIPIVSTLTMLWIGFGLLVVAGLLDGLYTLGGQPAVEAVAEPEVMPDRGTGRGNRGRGGRSTGQRAGGRAVGGTVATTDGSFRWAYPLLLVAALGLGWAWNLRNSYADMFLNQGQSFTARGLQDEAFSYGKLLRAVENDPAEDYYYLQLGNALLKMAYPYKITSQETFDGSTAPRPDQSLTDLFTISQDDTERAAVLFTRNSAEQMLQYAHLVLERAWQLSPQNKDHPANLGRLHSLWARRAGGGDEHLQQAVDWFEIAHRIAPNDASILNELGTTLAYLGDTEGAEARFRESLELDPRYAETYARLGELYRANGRIAEAADQFAEAVERNRGVLETDGRSLAPIIESLQSDPAALQQVANAYEAQKTRYDQQRAEAAADGDIRPLDVRFLSALARIRGATGDIAGMRAVWEDVVASDPDNVQYRQLYTLTLSDTLQFDDALQQAQQALTLAQEQQLTQQVSTLQQLIDVIRPKAGG